MRALFRLDTCACLGVQVILVQSTRPVYFSPLFHPAGRGALLPLVCQPCRTRPSPLRSSRVDRRAVNSGFCFRSRRTTNFVFVLQYFVLARFLPRHHCSRCRLRGPWCPFQKKDFSPSFHTLVFRPVVLVCPRLRRPRFLEPSHDAF